jgi:nicotinamide mononucleotide transporter
MIGSFLQEFLGQLKETSPLEYIAVFTGIISVWLSRKENIWLYPVGLVNTVIYIYLSARQELYGEASVNFYYTVVSIYGWIIWSRRNDKQQHLLQVTFSNKRELRNQMLFFAAFYVAIYAALLFLKQVFYANTIPWADAFASATAYTGMWLMARKKVESWWWWIATDFASVPLYYVKDFAFTSVYYLILLVMAVTGLVEWQRRARMQLKPVSGS